MHTRPLLAFNSYAFVFIFAPATVGGFWILLRRTNQAVALGWLLLASVVAYVAASPASLAILLPGILIDYRLAAWLMHIDASRRHLRRGILIAGIAINVLVLGYFKYKNFFLDTANVMLGMHFALTPLILPLGISFLTFQKIALLADVHSQRLKSVCLSDFLLFTLFFPRTLAGPIIYYNEVVPQFRDVSPRGLSTHLALGICLFSIGLFKKAVIADNLALLVPATFDVTHWPTGQHLAGLTAWEGVLAYSLQLYFDFSGYSDMALGSARLCGIQLPVNFDSPYKACSIVDFWNRWHITLTRFFTSYLYTPMVIRLTRMRIARGKPVLYGRHYSLRAIASLVAVPTLLTMTLSGLWHGAGWHFIAWGGLHGVYLTVNQTWRALRPRFWPDAVSYDRFMKPVGWVLTFTAVVVAFVLFRASSMTVACSILRAMLGVDGISSLQLHGPPVIGLVVLLVGVLALPNSMELLGRFEAFMAREELFFATLGMRRVAVTLIALLSLCGTMAVNHSSDFLYGHF